VSFYIDHKLECRESREVVSHNIYGQTVWQSAKDHITTWWLHDLRPHDFHDFTTCGRSRNRIYIAKMSF